jgi:hypothetical protein
MMITLGVFLSLNGGLSTYAGVAFSQNLFPIAPLLSTKNWKPGDECIVNFPLTDAQADEKFGKGGYRIQDVPSENGKDLAKHYLRWTKAANS